MLRNHLYFSRSLLLLSILAIFFLTPNTSEASSFKGLGTYVFGMIIGIPLGIILIILGLVALIFLLRGKFTPRTCLFGRILRNGLFIILPVYTIISMLAGADAFLFLGFMFALPIIVLGTGVAIIGHQLSKHLHDDIDPLYPNLPLT